jgi:hypothetical protein
MIALRTVRLVLVSLVLLLSAISGFLDAVGSWPLAASSLQKLGVVTQVLYVALSVVGLVALLTKRAWTLWVLVGWGLAVTATAAMAPVVWGDSGAGAVIAAGAGTALVAALVAWGGHRSVSSAPTGAAANLDSSSDG